MPKKFSIPAIRSSGIFTFSKAIAPCMTLLKSKPRPIIQETSDFNSLNGNDAEILAASKMVLACGAEISWGSRNEDGRKIDLIVSFDHPWFEKERLMLFVQVKSGDTYGRITKDGFILKTAAIKGAQRTSHNICLIWVERTLHKLFWAYIHPNTISKGKEYADYHVISPAIRFDLARCQAKILPIKEGGLGVIISPSLGDIKTLRKRALEKYRELNRKKIVNPYFGEIEFTRIGWRHMFRKSRSVDYKKASLDVVGHLEKIIIDKPSNIYCSDFEFPTAQANYQYRKMEYVLHYKSVMLFNRTTKKTENTEVIVRLLEEIRWPVDWGNKSTLTQMIDRRVVFLSCYYKTE